MYSQFPQLFSYSHNGPNGHQLSSPRVTIRSIPNEVLLEIFVSYRQSFEREGDYERVWNSNKGWFKLAHVCRNWRQVVLTSPSRLQLRLLLTEHRPRRAHALRRLPPLPIIVDYRSGTRSVQTQTRMISALAYPGRVCGINFNYSCPGRFEHSSKLLAAMNQAFPALKSLELHLPCFLELHTPPFVAAQTSHLQRLNFMGTVAQLSRVLPYTTSLVDLTLTLERMFFSSDHIQLLVPLQGLSSLRRLKVDTWIAEMLGLAGGTGYALLPTLTSFSFTGSMGLLNILVAGLAAPSLQELRITVSGTHAVPPLTHLTTFIHNSGRRFFSAQLNAPENEINLVMSAHSHSHSTDDPPFKVIASGMRSNLRIGDLFSEALATVEDVFLASSFCIESLVSPVQDTSHGNTFFMPFRSAKIIRVSPGIESKVGEMFRNELPPDLLPALEEIELNATMASCTPIRIDKKEVVSVLEPFQPFVYARQRAGHPVKVHWNTDRVLPEYFCNTEMEFALKVVRSSWIP